MNIRLIHQISAAGFSPEAGAKLYTALTNRVVGKSAYPSAESIPVVIQVPSTPRRKKRIGVKRAHETPIQAFRRVF
jgi:hypothetical protein